MEIARFVYCLKQDQVVQGLTFDTALVTKSFPVKHTNSMQYNATYKMLQFSLNLYFWFKIRLTSSSRVKVDSKLLFFPVILPVVIIQWTQRMLSYLEAWIMGVVLVVIIVGCISSNINNAMLSKTNLRQQKVVRSPDISWSRFLRALSAHWALHRRTDGA